MRILLLAADAGLAELLRAQLRRMAAVESQLEVVGTLAGALARLPGADFGLVVVEPDLPDSSGVATVEALARACTQPLVVVGASRDAALRAGALACGAFEILTRESLSAAALERLVRLAAVQARAFRSLRAAEGRFRSLIELSSDFYWETDARHRVVKIEHGARRRHPVANPAQLGKARWEMPATHPDAAGWAQHRATLEAHLPFRDFEVARLDDDGVERWRMLSGEPVFEADGAFRGYRGIGRDITERKRAEEELRRFRLAMDTSADMILLTDRATMRHVDVNDTACRLLGYSRAELLAMGPADVLPVAREALEQAYDALIAHPGRIGGMTSYYRCKDGSRLPFEATRRALRSNDKWLIATVSRDIRERLAAESALREGEARFRQTFELAASGIAHVALDGTLLRANPRLCETLGYREDELVGRSVKDISYPADRDATDGQRARVRAGELQSAKFEKRYLRKDGTIVWLGLTVALARDAGGKPQYEIAVFEDITARKREERLLALEHAVTRSLAEADSVSEALRQVLRAICESESWESGRYFHLDEAAGVMRFREGWCGGSEAMQRFNRGSQGLAFRRGVGLVGHVWASGEPLWVPDAVRDPRVANPELTRAAGVHGAFVFPVGFGGGVLGVLSLESAVVRAPDERQLQAMQVIGSQIGQFLKRKDSESGLRESEARFRSLTQLSSDWYWETDAEMRCTAARGVGLYETEQALLGTRREDLPGIDPEEQGWRQYQQAVAARLPFRDLAYSREANGERRYISISGEPLFDAAGVFKGYRGVGKNVTARKREERLLALEHSVTRLLADTENAAEALRAVIRALCQSEGWQAGRYFHLDEAVGVMRFRESWGESREAVKQFIDSSREFEFRPGTGLVGLAWESGRPVWTGDVHADPRVAREAMNPSSGAHGAFLFPVTFEATVTGVLAVSSRQVREPDERLLQTLRVVGSQVGQFLKRKDTESGLRESEERFRGLTQLSSDWYWELDAGLRFTKFEGGGALGERYLPAAVVLGKLAWEIEGIVRGSIDWEQTRARLERHESFRNLEYAYRDRAGRTFYVSADGEPVFDQGRFAGYRGTSRDITPQRRGEDDLRRFRAALDASADMVLLIDVRDGRLLDFNDTACRDLGYAREELLGRGMEEVRIGRSREALLAEYRALAASAERSDTVVALYRRKRGSTFPVEIRRQVLETTEGVILVVTARDLTERRQAEERQAAHLRRQERIARFGQSALGKRAPAELIDEAVDGVREGLAAAVVAYLEPAAQEGAVVARALAGAGGERADPGALACGSGDPVLEVLRSGTRRLAEGGSLALPWARSMGSVALIPVRGERGVRGVLCACYQAAGAFGEEEFNFAEAAASVLSTALQRIDSEGRLAYLAQFDPLTGLPNRALLADRFSQMIVQARRHGSSLGVLFIDLDAFKMVNDNLGHAGGDELLKETAVRLQSSVRSGDTVARISGDEFAVVLADLARAEDAALVAQKMLDRLGEAVEIGGKEVFVTASIGIAAFPGDGSDAEALLGAADAAMYRAKQSGRNAYQFFTAEINQRTRARAQMGAELRRALERAEFVLHYQPKYDLEDRRAHGAEALLRWNHPGRGMVAPAEFIPVLEETGLIVPASEWVLQQACADLKAWRAAGLSGGPIALNLSARQFRQHDLDARIKALIAAAGVEPALIELEITESHLMHDPEHAIRVMRSLREAGMRIAIDDFGTGYSSLSYLTRFPVGSLKIDRSFVADVYDDPGDAAIVRTIIEMAHTLGFTVVAEGVETEEQAKFLRLLRCEQAQGFLFSRPMPADEYAAMLRQRR